MLRQASEVPAIGTAFQATRPSAGLSVLPAHRGHGSFVATAAAQGSAGRAHSADIAAAITHWFAIE